MVGSEIYQFKLPKKVQNQKTSLPTLARFKKPIPIYFLKKSEMSAPRPQFRHLLLAGNAYFVGGSWIALRRHYYWQSLISEVREDHYYSPTPMKHYPFFPIHFSPGHSQQQDSCSLQQSCTVAQPGPSRWNLDPEGGYSTGTGEASEEHSIPNVWVTLSLTLNHTHTHRAPLLPQ